MDLVLLDLRMEGMHGLEGLARIQKAHPDLRVAILSGLAETEDIRQALDMGAAGFFPKTLSAKVLLKAIHLVLEGERYIPLDHAMHDIMPAYYHDPEYGGAGGRNATGRKLGPDAKSRAADDLPDILTRREREVLAHLMKGASNKEIARTLEIQVVTVKLHVRGLCKKLEVKNRTQAALKAQELGLGLSNAAG